MDIPQATQKALTRAKLGREEIIAGALKARGKANKTADQLMRIFIDIGHWLIALKEDCGSQIAFDAEAQAKLGYAHSQAHKLMRLARYEKFILAAMKTEPNLTQEVALDIIRAQRFLPLPDSDLDMDEHAKNALVEREAKRQKRLSGSSHSQEEHAAERAYNALKRAIADMHMVMDELPQAAESYDAASLLAREAHQYKEAHERRVKEATKQRQDDEPDGTVDF